MIGVGLIGFGYWGPNLARNFFEESDADLRYIVDKNPSRLETARRRFPGTQVCQDIDQMLADDSVHAVAIATPASSHYNLAIRALEAGKHVLLEKPMASTAKECRRLIETASARSLVLMIDHTFVYTGAVRHIRSLITSGAIGEILYYDSTRINLGLVQHDIDVIWDLAVHDLSIMAYLFDESAVAVSAVGMSHIPDAPVNIAYLTLFFPSNMIAHISVNWLAPVKLRRTIIGGSRKMIVYDDLEPSEKVKIYDKGVDVSSDSDKIQQMRVGYRIGDMLAPNVDTSEALRTEIRHFIDCVRLGHAPETPGAMGLEVVETLEAASLSMRRPGQPINIKTLEYSELKIAR
jgi:predicted dehydrogenase